MTHCFEQYNKKKKKNQNTKKSKTFSQKKYLWIMDPLLISISPDQGSTNIWIEHALLPHLKIYGVLNPTNNIYGEKLYYNCT